MKKLFRLSAIVVVVLFVAALILPMFISKDLLKEKLIEQVKEQTGRTLSIEGEMSVHVFPTASVSMEKVALSDIKESSSTPMVRVESLSVGVDLLPLLNKEIVISELELNRPVINLYVDEQGNKNWMFVKSAKTIAASATEKKPEEVKNNKSAPNNLQLNDFSIVDGQVIYQDKIKKEKWDIKELNISASLDSFSSPFDIEGSALWNKQKISAEATIGNLKAFLEGKGESPLKASVDGGLFAFNFDGKYDFKEYTGSAKLSTSSVARLQNWLSPEAKPAAAMDKSLELTSMLACTNVRCVFDKTALTFGDITANGKGDVNFANRKPSINLALAIDELNLNLLLPQDAKRSSMRPIISSAHAATAAGWSRENMDLSALNEMNATAEIKAGKVLFQDIKIGKTLLRTKLNNGRLSGDMLDTEFYGGKANVSFSYDANSSILEKRLNMKGIDMEPLLKDAMQNDKLSGKGNIELNLVGRGKSEYAIVSSLNGNGSIKLTDGAIKGINIADMVRNVQSAFKQVDTSSQKTDFAELGGTFTIANGVVKNNDLAMKAPLMRLSGAGQVNLPARTVNYRLNPEIVQTIQGQGGKDKTGLKVPVIVDGSFDKLRYRPDVAGIATDVLKDPKKYKETIKDVKEQFKGEKRKETLRNLRGLFKKPKKDAPAPVDEPTAEPAVKTPPATDSAPAAATQ